ncbi:prephenate dehydratase [Streptomyces fuscigenes]|uniref:prephenate dehydratase n=1 Tax=Streptomyces fuscigenes TaxID=1528880 RepID=UPI001F268A29|nr:prephenate dehydratase [Streptomyces fuscigenes]MCF3964442.1 prephenate dehydratase [Streptomyces fuscigenes]
MVLTIAYQGEPGSNSAAACTEMYTESVQIPCETFTEALDTVKRGQADVAVIPVDNSIAGRVADVHHLLPSSGLTITQEHFLPIHFDLMVRPGVALDDVRSVRSHVHALAQCRNIINAHDWKAIVTHDTAGAAREVAQGGDATEAALAPPAAAGLYDLTVLKSGVEDNPDNTTRFLAVTGNPPPVAHTGQKMITTIFFEVRNIPSSLYKALGGFASNGVNLTKIESYQNSSFTATEFYVDAEGHPEDPHVALALEELRFFSSQMKMLGVYPASPSRLKH